MVSGPPQAGEDDRGEVTPPPPTSAETLTSREDRVRAELLGELRRRLRAAQNRFAEKLGVPPRDREAIIADMLGRQFEDRVSYWLRLSLSLGIATFGLALDSTGVVIGAMLISPLMDPIVGLGMGLAVGSPYLTLRSSVRLGTSLFVVVAAAALLTLMLPFHTITREIAARTSPTLVDLSIAGLCALAAGFTTVRRSSDTVSAAAGTAIGIALVPPLCVVGYGLGIASGRVAGGATLLFTANLSAIVFFSVFLFVLLGFDAVEINRLESSHVQTTTRVAKIAARLRRVFGAKYGPLLRFLMPVALVAAVFVPLRSALGEVAWKVQVQGEVDRVISEVCPPESSVRTAVTVDSHRVAVRLIIVGSAAHASRVEQSLRERIAAAAGVVPTVQVVAVPDHLALESVAPVEVAEPDRTPIIVAPVPEPPPPPAPPDVDAVVTDIDTALSARWPETGGRLLGWSLRPASTGDPILEVRHTGAALGPVAEALLGSTLADAIGRPVVVRARAIPIGRQEAAPGDLGGWLPHLAAALATVGDVPQVRACVWRGPHNRTPRGPDGAADPDALPVPDPSAIAAEALLSHAPTERVEIASGSHWAVELTTGTCPAPAPKPASDPSSVADPVADPARQPAAPSPTEPTAPLPAEPAVADPEAP